MIVPKWIAIILTILAVVGVFFTLLLFFGYRFIPADNNTPDWNAISAVATCIGSCLIPVAVVFLQSALTENRKRSEELIQELADFKAEYGEDIKAWASLNRGDEELHLNAGTSSGY